MTGPFTERLCHVCGRKLGLGGRGSTGRAICGSCQSNPRTTDGIYGGRGAKKMTREDVTEARRMRSQFKTNREIARHFGVSMRTLIKYLKGDQEPAS